MKPTLFRPIKPATRKTSRVSIKKPIAIRPDQVDVVFARTMKRIEILNNLKDLPNAMTLGFNFTTYNLQNLTLDIFPDFTRGVHIRSFYESNPKDYTWDSFQQWSHDLFGDSTPPVSREVFAKIFP